MKPKISEIAKGKWPSILAELGLDKKFLSPRHGPCPLCAGKDRFRFDDKGAGLWFCNQCGAGDGVALLMKLHGWEFRAAAREIEGVAGHAKVIPIRSGPSEEAVRREMNLIWRAGGPMNGLEACARYWGGRTGEIPLSGDLRGVPVLRCPGHGEYPAMVALIRDVQGKPVNLHRTFLTPLGGKAPIPDPRRVMPIALPKGCAVRLATAAPIMGIAEGLETAAAAALLFGVPCWAALTANNLEHWEPPEGVEKVMVFGDNDRSLTGQAAAYGLGRRLIAKKVEAEVRLPERVGWDWNDVLQQKREAA